LTNAATDEAAHHAIDMLITSYTAAGRNDEVLPMLEYVVAALDLGTYPSRGTFARFRLVQKYFSLHRPQDAKQMADQTLAYILDRPFPKYHDYLCSELLLNAAYLHARDGESAAAETALSQLEAMWPAESAETLALHRVTVQALANAQ
jgi:hypothetical protein